MTEFVAAPDSRVLVVMPDGYRVWPDPFYDQFEDAALFGLSVVGVGEHGERVTVRGNHIARVGRSDVRPQSDVLAYAVTLAAPLDPPRDEDPSEGDWESEGGAPDPDDE